MLVFLDVDGTLIPLRARAATGALGESGNPLLDRLDPADGRRLLELGCQLVWATTWMAEANDVISPRLGLPELGDRRGSTVGAGQSPGRCSAASC